MAYGRGSGYIGVVEWSQVNSAYHSTHQVAVTCKGEHRFPHGAVQALSFVEGDFRQGSHPSYLLAGTHGGVFLMLHLNPMPTAVASIQSSPIELISVKAFSFATPIRFISLSGGFAMKAASGGDRRILVGEEGSLLHSFELRLPFPESSGTPNAEVLNLARTEQLHVRRVNGASIGWFKREQANGIGYSFGADVIVVGQGVQRLVV
jgi:hypothetical protein